MFGSGLSTSVLDGFDVPRRMLEAREMSFSITDPIFGWFALTTGRQFTDEFASRMLVCLNGEVWLPFARAPEATRPDWPGCAEGLLGLLGLGQQHKHPDGDSG